MVGTQKSPKKYPKLCENLNLFIISHNIAQLRIIWHDFRIKVCENYAKIMRHCAQLCDSMRYYVNQIIRLPPHGGWKPAASQEGRVGGVGGFLPLSATLFSIYEKPDCDECPHLETTQ